jgi:hypothetical protein
VCKHEESSEQEERKNIRTKENVQQYEADENTDK